MITPREERRTPPYSEGTPPLARRVAAVIGHVHALIAHLLLLLEHPGLTLLVRVALGARPNAALLPPRASLGGALAPPSNIQGALQQAEMLSVAREC